MTFNYGSYGTMRGTFHVTDSSIILSRACRENRRIREVEIGWFNGLNFLKVENGEDIREEQSYIVH